MTKLAKQISSRLKQLRQDAGWSLDKTAAETGVSKAMLGQIEREESSPTIATLWKIANGFNVSFSSFIAEAKKPSTALLKDDKIEAQTLFAYDETVRCEIFVIELLPGCEHISPAHKPGVIEHVIVVEGSMELFKEGAWSKLTKGQAVRFSANEQHGYRNPNKKVARIHNIIHYT